MSGLPETCGTPGCPGDPNYAAPGRGHVEGCDHPTSWLRTIATTSEASDAD